MILSHVDSRFGAALYKGSMVWTGFCTHPAMKFLSCAILLATAQAAFAATSFAGTNLYYAAGLSASQRATYLESVALLLHSS